MTFFLVKTKFVAVKQRNIIHVEHIEGRNSKQRGKGQKLVNHTGIWESSSLCSVGNNNVNEGSRVGESSS